MPLALLEVPKDNSMLLASSVCWLDTEYGRKNLLNEHKISFRCLSQVIQCNLCGVKLYLFCVGLGNANTKTVTTLTYELSWPDPFLKVQQCAWYLECQSAEPTAQEHYPFFHCEERLF